MKITCGTDIIEIKRIKESIESLGNRFIERVYTKNEIEYCESKNIQKYQHYAVRFSAKEAIFKALSLKIYDNRNDLNEHINCNYTTDTNIYSNNIINQKNNNDFSWTDFEIINDKNGRPNVVLAKNVDGLESIDISLSHCKEYAVAYVVAYFE